MNHGIKSSIKIGIILGKPRSTPRSCIHATSFLSMSTTSAFPQRSRRNACTNDSTFRAKEQLPNPINTTGNTCSRKALRIPTINCNSSRIASSSWSAAIVASTSSRLPPPELVETRIRLVHGHELSLVDGSEEDHFVVPVVLRR